jgi:4-hydroxy-tetrahydrodipicolinate reductase
MHPIPVIVNGLPGKMAATVLRHLIADERFRVLPTSLTGPEIQELDLHLEARHFRLVRPEDHRPALAEAKDAWPGLIAVDYTHPSAVNANARLYGSQGVPFVMGTTGGDRTALEETVRRSSVAAVIAPNMAKQIVGLQAMMAFAAEQFPGLFTGYRLEVRESHQQGKADTSGTARAMIGTFNRLGVPFEESGIQMVRHPDAQRALGVPEEYLGGHGWHTYTLTSADSTVRFELIHNVNGREIYACGTLDAVRFLDARVRAGARGQVFSMIDVLRAG